MFNNLHLDRLRQTFADQFEPDDNSVLYRKSRKGAPIRVSAAERDSFIAAFNRRSRYLTWMLIPATLILIAVLAWLFPGVDSSAADGAMWIAMLALTALFVAGFYWAWNTPARQLAGRPAEGAALSREELRQMTFSKLTYSKLGLVVLTAAGLVFTQSMHTDVLHGWGTLWLILAGLLVVVAAVQAFRKWRFDHR